MSTKSFYALILTPRFAHPAPPGRGQPALVPWRKGSPRGLAKVAQLLLQDLRPRAEPEQPNLLWTKFPRKTNRVESARREWLYHVHCCIKATSLVNPCEAQNIKIKKKLCSTSKPKKLCEDILCEDPEITFDSEWLNWTISGWIQIQSNSSSLYGHKSW